MNNSIYKFSLDIHEPMSQVVVELKQNDTAREFLISLTENGRPYVISKNCYAVFVAKKPDGTKILDECSIVGNTIRYVANKPGLTSSLGEVLSEIRLYGAENELLTSPMFTILVNAQVCQDEDIESTDEFSALTNIYTKSNELYKNISEKLSNGELQGEDGDSAYDIAVKNGFEGTEKEWLDWLYGPVYNTKKYKDIHIEYIVNYNVAATNDSFPEGTALVKFSALPETISGKETTYSQTFSNEIDRVCDGSLRSLERTAFGSASVRYGLPDYGNAVLIVDENDIGVEFMEADTGFSGTTVFPESGIYVLVCFADGQSGILVDDAEISIVFKGEIKKLDSDYLFVSDQVRKDSEYLITAGGVFAALPTKLSELNDDETHRTVTDSEKESWNAKSEKGDDGLSAYEIAVKNGFEGSETEWLESLQGVQGVPGPQGPQGEKGEQGPQGVQGKDGAWATINGKTAIRLNAGNGLYLSEYNGVHTIKRYGRTIFVDNSEVLRYSKFSPWETTFFENPIKQLTTYFYDNSENGLEFDFVFTAAEDCELVLESFIRWAFDTPPQLKTGNRYKIHIAYSGTRSSVDLQIASFVEVSKGEQMNVLTIGDGKNHNFGKLVNGILELSPAALIVGDYQYIGNDTTRYTSAGYLPIIYTEKTEDTDKGHYEAIYAETDGTIVQSWEFVSDIPKVTAGDNGKFLMVVDGKISAVLVPNITEEVF